MSTIPIPKEIVDDWRTYHENEDMDLNILFDYAAWHYYIRSREESDPEKSLEYLVYAEYYQEKANNLWRELP